MDQSLTERMCFEEPVHGVTIHPFGVLQVGQQLALVHGHHPVSVLSKPSGENSSSPASRKALLNLLR